MSIADQYQKYLGEPNIFTFKNKKVQLVAIQKRIYELEEKRRACNLSSKKLGYTIRIKELNRQRIRIHDEGICSKP